MKNPFEVNPSLLEFLLCPPIRLAQADSEREGITWTEAQCRFAAHAINQHDKLVVFCRRIASFGFSFDPRDQANGAYRDAVRGLVRDAAALLKEEKP